MASPHQQQNAKTRMMQFGPSIPPGVGANSIPRGEVVLTAEGVEWMRKDPPLLSSLRIKWWGQEGEGFTARVQAKSGTRLLTSPTRLVFPAMCGPKNLASYFRDMHNLTVELLDGSGPARVAGKAEVDVSDLVRLASVTGRYPIVSGQKTVGVLPLALSVNFFPTVVTSFELNEHHAEADTMTPVLPTPNLTTWRVATSATKTGVGKTRSGDTGVEITGVGSTGAEGSVGAGSTGGGSSGFAVTGAGSTGVEVTGVGTTPPGPTADGSVVIEQEKVQEGRELLQTEPQLGSLGAEPGSGESPGAEDTPEEEGLAPGDSVESDWGMANKVGGGTHAREKLLGEDNRNGAEEVGVLSELSGAESCTANATETDDRTGQSAGITEEKGASKGASLPLQEPAALARRTGAVTNGRFDVDLTALIARAEALREEMKRASETVLIPARTPPSRLAELQLPLLEAAQTAGSLDELIRPEATSRSSLVRLVEAVDDDDGFATRYGLAGRLAGQSVLSPQGSPSSQGSPSELSDSGLSDSWQGADSDGGAHGVAEDALLKELFFADESDARRRVDRESDDQDAPAGGPEPQQDVGGEANKFICVEDTSAVRMTFGHVLLASLRNKFSLSPPRNCTLALRFPVTPLAMSDIASPYPPQSLSLVPSKVTSKGLVFRHSAEFPVRFSDPDVRQLWQFGELHAQMPVGGNVWCRGVLQLEDVLGSAGGSFRTAVPLYIGSGGARPRRGDARPCRKEQRPVGDEAASLGTALPKMLAEANKQRGAVGENHRAVCELDIGDEEESEGGERAPEWVAGNSEASSSEWATHEGVLFGTLDLEIQLLGNRRGAKKSNGWVPAVEHFPASEEAGGETLTETSRLLVQVSGLDVLAGDLRSDNGKGIRLVAKGGKSGGVDVTLRASVAMTRVNQRQHLLSETREGVLTAPPELIGNAIAGQIATLVVEAWMRSHVDDVTGSQEALLGLVRVPLTRSGRPTKLRGLEVLALGRACEVWDPLTSSSRGLVTVTVWFGLDSDVRRFVWERSAAVTVQRWFRGFAARKRVAALAAARREELGMARGQCVRHTFRVTVVQATGLPAEMALCDFILGAGDTLAGGHVSSPSKKAKAVRFVTHSHSDGAGLHSGTERNGETERIGRTERKDGTGRNDGMERTGRTGRNGRTERNGGMNFASQLAVRDSSAQAICFVKYWFPGEANPLYTRNVGWSGSPRFGAQARHSITLPVAEKIGDYLGVSATGVQPGGATPGLRFEVWARVECDGEERALDLEERPVGAAELQPGAFLAVAAGRGFMTGREFKKAFELPLRLADGLPPGDSFPRLHVELSYQASAAFEHPLAGTVFAPPGQPLSELPIEAVLDIKIIRASGLQAAVTAALPTSPSLRTVLHSGAHSYVRLSLFPSDHDLELQYPPIHTPLQAQTFTPHYGFRRRITVTVTELVLRALKNDDMVLEVWHHAPRAQLAESTNSWLGTVSMPLRELIKHQKGVSGWFDILSRRGETVGAIELDIAIADWRPVAEPESEPEDDDAILTSPEVTFPRARDPGGIPVAHPQVQDLSPLGRVHGDFAGGAGNELAKREGLFAKLTVSVEEVILPLAGGTKGGLNELLHGKRTPSDRYYVVHDRYGESSCVSRAVVAQEGVASREGGSAKQRNDGGEARLLLDHTCETDTRLDESFLEYLEGRLSVEFWKVGSGKGGRFVSGGPNSRGAVRLTGVSGGGRSKTGGDCLVGTAYVSLSPLLDHGLAELQTSAVFKGLELPNRGSVLRAEKPKAASLSGTFALVHPDSPNLRNARVKVRVLLQVGVNGDPEKGRNGRSGGAETLQETGGGDGVQRLPSRSKLHPEPSAGVEKRPVTLTLDEDSDVTSGEEPEDVLEQRSVSGRQQEQGAVEEAGSPKRASEDGSADVAWSADVEGSADVDASDDVDEDEWLQQRALRRSAELLRRSADLRKERLEGHVSADPDIESLSDGEEWSVPDRRVGVDRREELTTDTACASLEAGNLLERKTDAARLTSAKSRGGGEAAQAETGGRQPGSQTPGKMDPGGADDVVGRCAPRGPSKRLPGHVTLTAPPKRGRPMGSSVAAEATDLPRGGAGRPGSPLPPSAALQTPEPRHPVHSPEPQQTAPPIAAEFSADALPTAGQAPCPSREFPRGVAEPIYTSIRVCIESAVNLQCAAFHGSAEEEFWAGAETSKTLKPCGPAALQPVRAETGSAQALGSGFVALDRWGSNDCFTGQKPRSQDVPQGLFVSYRWEETGEVICTPLVAPGSAPKWYHSRHLPLVYPSRKERNERILVLKVWQRLKEPESGVSNHVGGSGEPGFGALSHGGDVAAPGFGGLGHAGDATAPGFRGLVHVGGSKTRSSGVGVHARAQETVPSPDLDRLIGCAAIDLSPLFLGLDELCGWYSVCDLRQRSLGQVKVVVAPVDVILTSSRSGDGRRGQIRLGSPPQRGPPGRVVSQPGPGDSRGVEMVKAGELGEGENPGPGFGGRLEKVGLPDEIWGSGLLGRQYDGGSFEAGGSDGGFEVRSDGRESREDARGAGREPMEEALWGGRESSMEDVRLVLEELQEMSRKLLERRGLDEGGQELAGFEGGVPEPNPNENKTEDVSAEKEEASEHVVQPAEAKPGVKETECGESREGLTQEWHVAGETEALFAHVGVPSSVNAGGLCEEADVVACGNDDLEGGQRGDGWEETENRASIGLDFNEGGGGNDGWGQANPVQEAPLEELAEKTASGGVNPDVVETPEKEVVLPGRPEREAMIAAPSPSEHERAVDSTGHGGTVSQAVEESRFAAGRSKPVPQHGGLSTAVKPTPEKVDAKDGKAFSAAIDPPSETRPAECSLVSKERYVIEERFVPSDQLPPRPPKREASAKGYPFTLHSSITFMPAPLKIPRFGLSPPAAKDPLSGRFASSASTSREEEVEAFRGFSRRVEAVVSAAAASGPTWPRTTRDNGNHLSQSQRLVSKEVSLVAHAGLYESDGEGRPSKSSKKKYADKETERIARIMGMRSM